MKHCVEFNQLPQRWLDLHHTLGMPGALSGWLYALAVGRSFLLNKAEWAEFQKEASSSAAQTHRSASSFDSSPPCLQLVDAIKKHPSPGNSHRVLILGAGPVGMRLAIELKSAYGSEIEVVLLENRTAGDGLPIPFSRKWPIHIPRSILGANCQLPESFRAQHEAESVYLPWVLCELEAHLFQVALSIGCQVIHTKEPIQHVFSILQPNLVFDATGGRWQERGSKISEKPLMILEEDSNLEHGVLQFGIRPSKILVEDRKNLSFAKFDSGYSIPMLNNVPIATWMLKIRGVPAKVATQFLQFLPSINQDNWAFVWPTHLKTGEHLLLLHLRHSERTVLAQHLKAASPLSEVYTALSNLSDPRWKLLLNYLVDNNSDQSNTCFIEPPFLWKPEMFLGTLHTLKEKDGFKAIPVGDSLFHGHPQVGNGLGLHLELVQALFA